MTKSILTMAAVACTTIACTAHAGTWIRYTHDKQHRLTSADYSAAQPDARVAYQYDAANNLDMEVSITDSQYLRSFLFWLSSVWPDRLEPKWLKQMRT